MSQDVSNKFALGVLIPFFAILGGLIVFREPVQDWWYFRTYEPGYAIENLAELSGMSQEGERLFYRADPELIGIERIETDCDELQVLGCLVTGPKIFVLDYTKGDRQERDQAVVTAAHEMLHMAYFRLNENEKRELDPLLDAILESPDHSWMEQYLEGLSGNEYYDEAHAMIGTEIIRVGSELEEYFSRYFSNRSNVLEAYLNSRFVIKGVSPWV